MRISRYYITKNDGKIPLHQSKAMVLLYENEDDLSSAVPRHSLLPDILLRKGQTALSFFEGLRVLFPKERHLQVL